ncbi:MAG: hypothetical protein UW30_C0002G0011 [Candidatus Giovannonibacteria bacterium GW2011_GWA2_44_13b]|uniref:Uncharacterized protein n=2 Tax=Candidatus Giovannoniibacteriota TaxID=1752738 RepID=A0A0G1H5N9_9BACT|nr:MAG: hypothetical protein UW30_C0002G0011 [Candidatus Giovannonibacteria bacterium GW2011_GWA2_44_13b]
MIYHSSNMPHVSRRKLKKKVFKKISSELSDFITKASSSQEIGWIFRELLTPTEKIMFSKRLALFLMLERRYSFASIGRTLKITPQTVVRFWKKTKEPGYAPLVKRVEKNKKGIGFLKDLEEMLLIGMPARGKQWMAMRDTYNRIHKK